MQLDEPRARIGHRGSVISRAKEVALKALVVLAFAVTVVSAFLVSLVFVAIGLTVVLVAGGYLWWQTREVRRRVRERMQAGAPPRSSGEVIEGEVIMRERTGRG